jgi:hypothetical protein
MRLAMRGIPHENTIKNNGAANPYGIFLWESLNRLSERRFRPGFITAVIVWIAILP